MDPLSLCFWQAHGGGFVRFEGRWWWYGEGNKNEVGVSEGVNAYSSQSIEGPWKFEGQVQHRFTCCSVRLHPTLLA